MEILELLDARRLAYDVWGGPDGGVRRIIAG
jgi:hypothetical protein